MRHGTLLSAADADVFAAMISVMPDTGCWGMSYVPCVGIYVESETGNV